MSSADRRPEARPCCRRREKREGGLLIDFAADGRAIGIEITAPATLSLDVLNRALGAVDQKPATASELAPFAA